MPLHISLWVFGIVQSHTFWLLWYWILLAKEHPLRHIWGYNYTWMKEGEVNAQIPLMLSKYHSIKKMNDFDINKKYATCFWSRFLFSQKPTSKSSQNTQKVKKNVIWSDKRRQDVNFKGNPLFQSYKQYKNKSQIFLSPVESESKIDQWCSVW